MKGKLRIFAFVLALAMLLAPNAVQGEGVPYSPAARLNVTVNAMTPTGESGNYGPAVPLSDSPEENRLWLQVPPFAFFSGKMGILIEDKLQEYVLFQPASGVYLENINDTGANLSKPSVSIKCFDAAGNLVNTVDLYISSQEGPSTEEPVWERPTEKPIWEQLNGEPIWGQPTEKPVWEQPNGEPIWERPNEEPVFPSSVTVRYLNEAGEPIAEDSIIPVIPGANTIYPEAVISDDYELTELGVKEVFVDANGVNPPVVEFHYALKEITASVKINYVDVNGDPLMESTYFTTDGGEHPVSFFPVEGYTVLEPSMQTVYVDRNGANPPEITFVYEREVQPVNVTIHYVDQNGEPLRNDDVHAFSKGVHNALAVMIPGYTLENEAEQPVLVDENGAQPQEITFVYQREIHPVEIPVHYVDENGEKIAEDTSRIISSSDNVVLPAGGVSPDDYELTSLEAVEVLLDGDGAHPAEVTFQYRRVIRPAQVTLHYVDDIGNAIAEDSVVSVPGGESVVTPQADIDPALYALLEPGAYPVTVTLEGASSTEFTFAYQRLVQPVKVIVRYLDERGEAIVPESEALFEEGTHQVRPMADISNEDYILTSPEFYPLTVTLEGASESEFTFTYQRVVKPVQVTVHYVNEAGEPVAEDTYQTLTEGPSVVFYLANIENYYLPEGAEPFQNVIVDADGAHPDEVTFVLQHRSAEPVTIPVLYVDQDTGLEIALSSAVTVQPDSEAEVSALPAPEGLLRDYLLVSEPVVSVRVDSNGVSSVSQVVFNYIYNPQPDNTPEQAPDEEPSETPPALPTPEPTEEPPQAQPVAVTVHYLDAEGKPVAQDSTVRCDVGDTAIKAAPVDLLEGYVPDGPQDALVHVDENGATPAEITFLYRYMDEAPAPKVALVNVKYLDPDGNVFYSYPSSYVEGRDSTVYINWDYVDPSLGYVLDSPDTVQIDMDSTGAAIPEEVVFQFKNGLSANLWVYYRDLVTGQDVASPNETTCYPGANTVDATPLNLESGYTISGPSSVTVMMSQDGVLTPGEVEFKYWRDVTEAPAATTAPYTEPMDAYFYPTGPSVHVRSTTSTVENNILGMVSSGDLGRIRGKITTGEGKVWYSVEINGLVGYMSDTVVRFLNEAEIMALFNYTPAPTIVPTPLPTEVPVGIVIDRWGQTNAKVNFRRAPEKNAAKIGELHKNERVWIYSAESSKDEKWYSVNHKGTTGYVMAKYVDILDEAESEQIQRSLASPVPTNIPPATPVPTPDPTEVPTPEPTPEPTEEPTPDPTEEPTPVPVTETPTETPTPQPTETPAPYRGYALTIIQTELRTGVSPADDTIQTLAAQTLVDVKAETSVDRESWAHAQVVGSENLGYIPMSSLLPISNDEAKIYRDQIIITPEVTASPSPEQVEGYAMTLGSGVPLRNYPDTNGEIITLLPYTAVAYVYGQQYTDAAWHLVQYNGIWGFIRQDQMRMMSQDEVSAYEESMIDSTPSPSPAPTPEPITQTSLSSYGHVQSSSGKVNLRSRPSVSSTPLRLLENYAFALVLGTEAGEEPEDEKLWYHVSQAGTEGYIRSDYFHVLLLSELSDFLQSPEYLNANSSTSEVATISQLQPVEDYNRNVWKNPNLTASYEPFNPFGTATPAPETAVLTNPPEPSDTPVPSATPQIAPVGPTGGNLPEPNVQQGGAPWPWVLLGLAVVGGGGAYYAYTVHNQNKKRAALRAQQARQARSQAAAHPQMRAAQNNPVQPANRPAQTVNHAAPSAARGEEQAYLPPKPAAPKSSQAAVSFKPIVPNADQAAVSGETKTYPAKLSQGHTQVYQTHKPAATDAAPTDNTANWKPLAKPKTAQASSPEKLPERPASPVNAPEQPAVSTDDSAAPHKRVRRTERHKDIYNQNDQA